MNKKLKFKAKTLIIFNADQHSFIGEPTFDLSKNMQVYDFLRVILEISVKKDLKEALPFLLKHSKLYNYTRKKFFDSSQTLENIKIKDNDIIVVSMIPNEELLLSTVEKILNSINMTVWEIKHGD